MMNVIWRTRICIHTKCSILSEHSWPTPPIIIKLALTTGLASSSLSPLGPVKNPKCFYYKLPLPTAAESALRAVSAWKPKSVDFTGIPELAPIDSQRTLLRAKTTRSVVIQYLQKRCKRETKKFQIVDSIEKKYFFMLKIRKSYPCRTSFFRSM